jgi:hypothetical protein
VTPLDLVQLPKLMALTAGRSDITVGLIDGPIAMNHPDLTGDTIREVPGKMSGSCTQTNSAACLHGTFVAGILCAKRGSAAPAICPDCTLLAYPIFAETASGNAEMPSATPEDLAVAILACIEAGARILNLSLALTQSSSKGNAHWGRRWTTPPGGVCSSWRRPEIKAQSAALSSPAIPGLFRSSRATYEENPSVNPIWVIRSGGAGCGRRATRLPASASRAKRSR